MQQRLIIPDLRIKMETLQRQHRLRKLPILIRTDFDRRPQRHEELQPDEKRQSRIVFIGRNLPEEKIRKGFESCVA